MKTADEKLTEITNEMGLLISEMRKYQVKALCIIPFMLGYPLFSIGIVSYELYSMFTGTGTQSLVKIAMWMVSCVLVLKITSEMYPDREMIETQGKLIALRERVETEMKNE